MPPTDQTARADALCRDLGSRISGAVRFDRLYRTLYATDASIYEIVPTGVVLPRDVDDVIATVNCCRKYDVPMVARGGGTGLTGGAIGGGVLIDFSRFMTGVWEVDPDGRSVRVHPGVVLDELNAQLVEHGVFFAPDLSTSSRATIGGMIANNACGAHSVLFGRTVDHVVELTVVLSDGSVVRWPHDQTNGDGRRAEIDRQVNDIVTGVCDDIRARYPNILRKNGGYALDRVLGVRDRLGVGTLICGSEGTLGVVVEARLKLTNVPRCRGLVLVHFDDLFAALDATPVFLEYEPAAIELIDRLIMEAALRDPSLKGDLGFVTPQTQAIMAIEWFADTEADLRDRINGFVDDMGRRSIGFLRQPMFDLRQQHTVWEMRKRGLGLLMSRAGDVQPYAFVEDSAVPPERLGSYIREFRTILDEEDIPEAAYYAHASVGVIHVRPALNLKSARDISRMQSIADRVSDLALRYGGAMTGEHGDGLLRSCWLEKMYGRRIVDAFGRVKNAFDPQGLFNPGKIVDPLPMTEHLRYGSDHETIQIKTGLDFSPHSGLASLANMCSGVGQCRQKLVGTMCPSFQATGDEMHTTRARANALRSALSNRGLMDGLDDRALDEVMDLCLQCKACKTECPTGVDMGRMKSEWLSRRHQTVGMSPGNRAAAHAPRFLAMVSRVPRLANLVMQSRPARGWAEKRLGFDRRIRPPRLATKTFRQWWRQRRGPEHLQPGLANPVVYLVDTWANFCTPSVAIATVRVLESVGFQVIVPVLECCGRTLISQGLLCEAKTAATANVSRLLPYAKRDISIVGSEPGCLFTLADEYPALLGSTAAAVVASRVEMIETLVTRVAKTGDISIPFNEQTICLKLHGHCHQKAMIGMQDALEMLRLIPHCQVAEINSGCCGMAGSFGHEVAHYDIAKTIGEQRLFPAIRQRGTCDIAVWGFSCRCQIAHHTDVTPRHGVEWFADALR